jgi:tetratricopeptide (TPR) repeat protein
MKKILCLSLAMAAAGATFAQKPKIREAGNELEKANLALNPAGRNEAIATEALNKAKAAIDAAVLDESTKDNSKAWFTKAAVYITMMDIPSMAENAPYKEGVTALKKALELDKKIANEEQFPAVIVNGAYFYYNDGAYAMNASRNAEAHDNFKEAYNLLNFENGKLAKDNKQIDTLLSKSYLFQGYTAFYDNNLDEAETILKKALNNPITAESDVYLVLSQIYGKQKKVDQQLAIINEGKKKFPGDKNISAAEINYYIENNMQDQMIAKLEEAVAADPTNATLLYNLGIVYKDMANNPSVADAEGYFAKAEKSFTKTLELAPDNGNYFYETGALYFNKAVTVNDAMNKTGTSSAELKKYDNLKVQRDALFAKALPYLEQSVKKFEANKKKLSALEMGFFKQALDAMVRIYAIQDQIDKMNAAKAKLESLD